MARQPTSGSKSGNPLYGCSLFRMLSSSRTSEPSTNITMKNSIKFLVAVLLVTPAVTHFTGCAATSTRESTGEYVDDSAITTKVKSAFAQDPVVKARDVKVETFKGVVQLSGFVDTAQEKSRAADLASGVSGVKSVTNNITVK